jgi:hypothetical protein
MPRARKSDETNRKVGAPMRTKFLKVRCTEVEYEQIQQRAEHAGLNLSDYLRHAAFQQKIIAPDAYVVLGELRRIGALIKHCYPAVQNWSSEEKRRYWQTREQLLACADQLARRWGIHKTDRKVS